MTEMTMYNLYKDVIGTAGPSHNQVVNSETHWFKKIDDCCVARGTKALGPLGKFLWWKTPNNTISIQ